MLYIIKISYDSIYNIRSNISLYFRLFFMYLYYLYIHNIPLIGNIVSAIQISVYIACVFSLLNS